MQSIQYGVRSPQRLLVAVLLCLSAAPLAIGAGVAEHAAPAPPAEAEVQKRRDEGLRQLEERLNAATDALVAVLEQKRPEGKQLAIAPEPLIDEAGNRPRVIGRRAAEIVMVRLTELDRPWLRVLNRVDLQTLVQEGKVSTAGSRGAGADGRSGPLVDVGRADLLIAGTTTVHRRHVHLELRLTARRTGRPIPKATQGFDVELTPEVRPLLKYPQRGPDGEVDDVAPVTDIGFTVTAQRANRLRGFVKEWTVEEGQTLRGGDRFDIEFTADADACLYIFAYGSDREACKLFPPDDWKAQFQRRHGHGIEQQDYYVYAEMPYHAPGRDTKGNRLFYVLDEEPGRNVLYFCANRTETLGVGNLCRVLENLPSDEVRMEFLEERFDHVETFEFRQQ